MHISGATVKSITKNSIFRINGILELDLRFMHRQGCIAEPFIKIGGFFLSLPIFDGKSSVITLLLHISACVRSECGLTEQRTHFTGFIETSNIVQKQNRYGLVRTMTVSKSVLLICEIMLFMCEVVVASENVQLQAGTEQLLGFPFLKIACSPT